MGNNSSRKDQKKPRGKAVHALSRIEELRGPGVDSYDKLIAWLAEMAESEHVELDTGAFITQLSRVCAQNRQQQRGRAPNLRQKSASCESHASSDTPRPSLDTSRPSLDTPRFHRDSLEVRGARLTVGSRQTTLSDAEEEWEMRQASVESLYSGSDRDSDLDGLFPGGGADFRRPLSELQRPLLGKPRSRPPGSVGVSSSLGDLDRLDRGRRPRASGKKCVSLHNLSPGPSNPTPAVKIIPDSPRRTPDLFLDDALLDGNIADILFSVEALWPK